MHDFKAEYKLFHAVWQVKSFMWLINFLNISYMCRDLNSTNPQRATFHYFGPGASWRVVYYPPLCHQGSRLGQLHQSSPERPALHLWAAVYDIISFKTVDWKAGVSGEAPDLRRIRWHSYRGRGRLTVQLARPSILRPSSNGGQLPPEPAPLPQFDSGAPVMGWRASN